MANKRHRLSPEKRLENITKVLKDRKIDVVELISESGVQSRYKLFCNKDNLTWVTSYAVIMRGSGCPQCANLLKLSAEQCLQNVKDKIKDKKIELKRVLKERGARSRFLFKCLIDGHEWESGYGVVVYGNSGCPLCARNIKLDPETRKTRLLEAFENRGIELIGLVKENANTSVYKMSCKCGAVWEATYSSLVNYLSGCPFCNESKGELAISKNLDMLNIEYHKQHKFKDCKNILMLPFDFYIPTLHCCIEFHGCQHFRPVDKFGGVSSLEATQYNDYLKYKYCKDNHIKLLCIVEDNSRFIHLSDGYLSDLPSLLNAP